MWAVRHFEMVECDFGEVSFERRAGRQVGAKVAAFEGGARAWPLISLSKASSLNAFASTMPDNLARQVAC